MTLRERRPSTAPTPPVSAGAEHRWRLLGDTARTVRVQTAWPCPPAGGRRRRHLPALVLLASAASGALVLGSPQLRASAGNPADTDLFSLTNQDRASNGVPSLQVHTTLGAIAENLPYSGCGFMVYGRSQDMINRNYFSHPIAGCGQLVFSIMQANNIHYASAGENIGWDSGTADAASSASYINTQFMNSPEHRSNILSRAYTHLGIGAAQSNSWSGAGSTLDDVWMFSEEFATLGPGSPPPRPSPPIAHPPPRLPPTASPLPARNQPAPPAPSVPPAATDQPAPAPAPTTAPTPVPAPVPSPDITPVPPPGGDTGEGLPAPAITHSPGLLSGSVEAVLEAYLVD